MKTLGILKVILVWRVEDLIVLSETCGTPVKHVVLVCTSSLVAVWIGLLEMMQLFSSKYIYTYLCICIILYLYILYDINLKTTYRNTFSFLVSNPEEL